MKIGIDASRYGHELSTGVELYSKHIIDNLLEQISKKGDNEVILYSRTPLKINSKFARDPKVKNRVIKAKKLWTIFSLSKEMRKNPPDVLFVPSHILPLFRPKYSVITIHDTAFKHLRKPYSFFQYHYLNWSTKYAVKHASKIIVPSNATAKDLEFFYKCPKEKIVVIPHGFTPPPFSAAEIDETFKTSDIFKYFGINKNMKYMLFVGRLETKKNLVNLVRAFHEFSQIHFDYKLILAGMRGTGFGKILKTVDELEMMHKIIMPGYITELEKLALYKNCQVFTFPSLYEGFGLPILEAFYFQKPIITSRVSSLPEVAKDAALYIDPYDFKDIVRAMSQLTNEAGLKEDLIKRGGARLKNFSWEVSAKDTLKVLTS